MRTEFTRQTRWSHDPEPIDDEGTPPGQIYVKQVVWIPCNGCDLQVHAALTQFLLAGVVCPDCGTRLNAATVLGNADSEAAKVMQDEEYLRDQAPWESLPGAS
jgi:hypothetical protein